MKGLVLIICLFIIGCGSSDSNKEIYNIGDIGVINKFVYAYYDVGLDVNFDYTDIEVLDVSTLKAGEVFLFKKGDVVIIDDIKNNYLKLRKVDGEYAYWIMDCLFTKD